MADCLLIYFFPSRSIKHSSNARRTNLIQSIQLSFLVSFSNFSCVIFRLRSCQFISFCSFTVSSSVCVSLSHPLFVFSLLKTVPPLHLPLTFGIVNILIIVSARHFHVLDFGVRGAVVLLCGPRGGAAVAHTGVACAVVLLESGCPPVSVRELARPPG